MRHRATDIHRRPWPRFHQMEPR